MDKISTIPVVAVSPTSIDDDGSKLIKTLRNSGTDSAVAINKLISAAKKIDARLKTVEEETINFTDLVDVELTEPEDGQLLIYETATGLWKNKEAASSFGWSSFPVGWMNLFYGSLESIPAGWQACDGTNGTPDMRNKVPLGVSPTRALGSTGGAETHTLSVTEIPSHSHSGIVTPGAATVGGGGAAMIGGSGSTGSIGGGAAHNNMQPYVALYYIMRVS